MLLGDAVDRIEQIGNGANDGNPWLGSELRADDIRKRLGFWSAIGAGRVELSWIANGFSLRMAVEPERLAFPNHKSTREHAEFVTAEIDQGLAVGSYIEVQPGYAHVVNHSRWY